MSNKKSPSNQLELPGFGSERQYERVFRTKATSRWYYVAIVLTGKMLALDDKGAAVWLPDNLVNYTPHLFANRRLAIQTARLYPLAIVKGYPWKVSPHCGGKT